MGPWREWLSAGLGPAGREGEEIARQGTEHALSHAPDEEALEQIDSTQGHDDQIAIALLGRWHVTAVLVERNRKPTGRCNYTRATGMEMAP